MMILSGVICFFGSILVRFEFTDYGTAKKRSGKGISSSSTKSDEELRDN